MRSSKTKKKSKDILEKFGRGEDISKDFDFELGTKTINLDLPIWAIRALDKESMRRGIARQALIKTWLIDHLDGLKEKSISA